MPKLLVFLSVFTILLFSACNNDDDENGNQIVTARIDESAYGIKQGWEKGDRIMFYNKEEGYCTASFKLKNGGGTSLGKFKSEPDNFLNGLYIRELYPNYQYTVVYPAIDGAATIEDRERMITEVTQIGNGNTDHIQAQYSMSGNYVYPEKSPISFKLEYTTMTIKLEKPDTYDIAIHGAPVSLRFFDGDKKILLTLKNIDWSNEITAYMLVKAFSKEQQQTFNFDLICANGYLFQKKISSNDILETNMRYTTSLTGNNKLMIAEGYTLSTLNDITDNIDILVIADVITSETDLSVLTDKLRNPDHRIHLMLPRATSIGDYAFQYCKGLASINFPKATLIGDYAFSQCDRLVSANLPVVATIGNRAFSDCCELKSVDFPVATSIGSSAFYDCIGLTSANLPAVTSIKYLTFSDCRNLTSVNSPAVTSIEDNAFYNSGITSVDFPLVDSVGYFAFYRCGSLVSIYLPMATSIGGYAFCDTSVTSINLPAVTSIGYYAFSIRLYNQRLTNLEIATASSGLDEAGVELFEGVSLSEVDLTLGIGENSRVNGKYWRDYGPFKSITIK
ncbi:MAG: leucine-rich repeat domain-containing protein [Prevotella sp.]|jgi:hypothetical protein|nr:leucine-rich repeat domain-containing protein [Prevotella sp.]